jgi:hypothetical protein
MSPHHHRRCTVKRVPYELFQGFFHCPAFSAPLPAELPAFSIPPVSPCNPSPTALVPVVLLIVSPTPRPAVPTIPPAVFVMPPTALPSCGVFVSDGSWVYGCVLCKGLTSIPLKCRIWRCPQRPCCCWSREAWWLFGGICFDFWLCCFDIFRFETSTVYWLERLLYV